MSTTRDLARKAKARVHAATAPRHQYEPEPETHWEVGVTDAKLSGWFLEESDELYRGFPISADDVVVDVGCGDGGHMAFCANRGAHVIAVDIDTDALAKAKDRLVNSKARKVDVFDAPAEHLPVEDGFATRVVCNEVLEHVDDPRVVVAELVRIAAPGALFLITCPDSLHEQMQSYIAPPSYFEKPNHIRKIERDELVEWFSDAGLEILDTSTYAFYWSIWWALFWAADGVDLDDADHPLLNQWSALWSTLLSTEQGRRLKSQLDQFLPKSQVLLARKPA